MGVQPIDTTTWTSGRESKLLDDIIAGRKTIEGRLNKGKFAQYQVGDYVSLRRDYRDENGVLHDGEPCAALVEIVAIRSYETFIDMVNAEGYAKVIPHATSAQEAADEYNKYYSAEDQAKYGVLAIEVRPLYFKNSIPLSLLRKFETKRSWLRHDSYFHGVDHMARVFILQELICSQLENQGIEVNRQAVRFAAMAHDVGRIDDSTDLDHGRRSAEWIKENLSADISSEMMDTVTYIVHWHVPPDHEAPVMTTELKALKDADGLDRVRLGDLDVSRLRTDVARALVGTAEDLYYESQQSDGEDSRSFQAVLEAAMRLGLVYDDEDINLTVV